MAALFMQISRKFLEQVAASSISSSTIVNGSLERHFMAYFEGRDFMFCDLCGTMRTLSSTKHAQCPLCKRKRSVKGITLYVSLLQDIRRELGISIICEEKVQLQKTDAKTCEKCGHNEHTYYSRQMRSADEGATTFYVCTNCQHQFTEN
ncbi:hypothetical protein GBA52_018165 [Prunus armeniaca]|nr:hypothetical protein GBA52_018165 [Prunus armeniaca]